MTHLFQSELDKLRELFEERAAILEYEARMPRVKAEQKAREEIYGTEPKGTTDAARSGK